MQLSAIQLAVGSGNGVDRGPWPFYIWAAFALVLGLTNALRPQIAWKMRRRRQDQNLNAAPPDKAFRSIRASGVVLICAAIGVAILAAVN